MSAGPFADRAGHHHRSACSWKRNFLTSAKAGQNNFGEDPPNAVLSVYEPGQADNTVVVVEITNPVVDGADLVYSYKIIKGKMPAGSGATSLFIDWIGVGGGVGRGFHGVGLGRRGVGIL